MKRNPEHFRVSEYLLFTLITVAALSLSGTCMQGLLKKGQLVAQGSVNAVLCSAQLDPVYGMDVCAWMQTMFSQWSHAPC